MTKTTNKPAFTVLTGTAKITAAISSIEKRGKRLDRDIWIAAVSVMAHHAEHGDITLVNRLVDAMPKGSRVNALREFILAHGKVTWNEELKTFAHDKTGTFDLEGAMSKSWTEFKPEPEYVPFDAYAALNNLLKKVEKADSAKGDNVPEGFASRLSALMAEIAPEPSF